MADQHGDRGKDSQQERPKGSGSGIDRRQVLGLLGVGFVGAAAGAMPAMAQYRKPSARKSTSRVSPKVSTTASFGARVNSVTVTPSFSDHLFVQGLHDPRPGKNANVSVHFGTNGSGTKSVPWRIEVDGEAIASGTKTVSAGSSFHINRSWNATPGHHTFAGVADPGNTLGETSSARKDNTKSTTLQFDPFVEYGDRMFEAVRYAVDLWKTQARLRNAVITGPMVIAPAGCLVGPNLKSFIESAPPAMSVPSSVRRRFARGVADAWSLWQGSVLIPGHPWYPSFAAHPGPVAPPTPNIPAPLASLPQNTAVMSSSNLRGILTGAFSGQNLTATANDVLDAFAAAIAFRFSTWRSRSIIRNALGQGPIPSFAPPFIPVGPVIGGTIVSAPGILATAPGL